MFTVPPIPAFDGLHPLVVHIPIALVFVVPIVVLFALAWKKQRVGLLVVGAVLMAVAAGGAVLATETGEAAEKFAKGIDGAASVLDEHEELGEKSRNILIGLAAAMAVGSVVVWKAGDKAKNGAVLAGGLVYLVAHGAGALVVANTGHQGGRLVHEFGVRAWAGPAATRPAHPVRDAASGGEPRGPRFSEVMIDIDGAMDALQAMRAAGWKADEKEPTVTPESKADAVATLMKSLKNHSRTKRQPADFMTKLETSIDRAEKLHGGLMLVGSPNALSEADLETRFNDLVASCKDCHRVYKH